MGDPISSVYFPTAGVFSITTSVADGGMVEAATIGDEGMVGVEAVLCDTPTANGETMLQVPAAESETVAMALNVVSLRSELSQVGVFRDLLGRYAHTMFGQAMQSLACNTLHNIEERCCRWLLMTHDRIHADKFALSHEFLATMLGARRQSVTVVAGALQSAGFIRYKHGWITIVDRAGLESAACECYASGRQKLDQVFSGPSAI
jgi:CRP-like cAMP-binding protein